MYRSIHKNLILVPIFTGSKKITLVDIMCENYDNYSDETVRIKLIGREVFLRIMHSGPYEGIFLCVILGVPFEGIFLRVMHGGPFEVSFTCNAWWTL